MTAAAIVATALLLIVGAFQIALAAGAPLGRAAWGGRHAGVLPNRLRVASGGAGVVVYPVIAGILLVAAGLVGPGWSGPAAAVTLWALTALFALGAVANLASRSPIERIWAPVSAGISICCAVIAAGT